MDSAARSRYTIPVGAFDHLDLELTPALWSLVVAAACIAALRAVDAYSGRLATRRTRRAVADALDDDDEAQ